MKQDRWAAQLLVVNEERPLAKSACNREKQPAVRNVGLVYMSSLLLNSGSVSFQSAPAATGVEYYSATHCKLRP